MTGTVKSIVNNRNFGFIRCEGLEYFFHRDDFSGHWDDLLSDLYDKKIQVSVEFTESISPKGKRAIEVRRTDWPNV